MSILDLPFAISPVVTGLMLVLLYGRNGWFAPVLDAVGFNVVFAFPGAAMLSPHSNPYPRPNPDPDPTADLNLPLTAVLTLTQIAT